MSFEDEDSDMNIGDSESDVGIGVDMSKYNKNIKEEAVENEGDDGEIEDPEGDDDDDDDDQEISEDKSPPLESPNKTINASQGLTMKSLQGLNFHDRSAEFYKQVQIKKEMIENEQTEKELEHCPFHPQIRKEGETLERRSVGEFLESQKALEEKRRERLKLQQLEKETSTKQQLSTAPMISENSKDILKESDYVKEEVTSRLTKQNKVEKDELVAEYRAILDQDSTFKPSITQRAKELKREVKVNDWLYLDAQRRKGKVAVSPPQKEGEGEEIATVTINNDKLKNKYIISRLDKDFNGEFNKWGESGIIGHTGLLNLLIGLNMLLGSKDEEIYVDELWQILRGKEFNGITYYNLRVCIAAILHITLLDNLPSTEIEFPLSVGGGEQSDYPPIVGRFDLDTRFILTDADRQFLHKKYYKLMINRQLKLKEGALLKPSGELLPDFKPKLSPRSTKLANERKERHGLNEASNADVLIEEGQSTLLWRKRNKEMQEENEKQNCSFKPAIIQMSKERINRLNRKCLLSPQLTKKKVQRTSPHPSKNRWDDLYNISKETRKGIGRANDDIELEREANEYTFKPKTNNAYKKSKCPNNINKIINNSQIEKMKKARKEKERIEEAKTRGYARITETNRRSKTQKKNAKPISPDLEVIGETPAPDLEGVSPLEEIVIEEAKERDPLILIDVNLGEKEERIMIYDKNENAQEVAQRFSDIHNLDEEMTEKLTELIEQQMSELTTVQQLS